ncbi:MAG: hypothetical protein AAF512_17535 [Pseudomonadota bacterium]
MHIFRKAHYSVLLFAFIFAACGGVATVTGLSDVRELRNAQAHFDKAANMENELAVNPLAGADFSSDPLIEYKSAAAILNEMLGDEVRVDGLRVEGLLGNAYILQAFTALRISNLQYKQEKLDTLDDARRKIDDALLKLNGLNLGTRDRVLKTALPGLVDHAYAMRAIDMTEVYRRLGSAYNELELSLEGVPEEHPIHTYIRMSQIQVLKLWRERIFEYAPSEQRRAHMKSSQMALRAFNTVCADGFKQQWQDNKEFKDYLKTLVRPLRPWRIVTNEESCEPVADL